MRTEHAEYITMDGPGGQALRRPPDPREIAATALLAAGLLCDSDGVRVLVEALTAIRERQDYPTPEPWDLRRRISRDYHPTIVIEDSI